MQGITISKVCNTRCKLRSIYVFSRGSVFKGSIQLDSIELAGSVETNIKFPVWFEPKASGATPMREALSKAAEELAVWCDAHPDC